MLQEGFHEHELFYENVILFTCCEKPEEEENKHGSKRVSQSGHLCHARDFNASLSMLFPLKTGIQLKSPQGMSSHGGNGCLHGRSKAESATRT